MINNIKEQLCSAQQNVLQKALSINETACELLDAIGCVEAQISNIKGNLFGCNETSGQNKAVPPNSLESRISIALQAVRDIRNELGCIQDRL